MPELLAVPAGAVTLMAPLAPPPTLAVMEVLLFTVNEVAGVPPKVTAVAPRKLVPVMFTVAPGGPLGG